MDKPVMGEKAVKDLVDEMKEYAQTWEGEDVESLKQLGAALPTQAIPPEAITEALKTLTPLMRAILLRDLARLERYEVFPALREEIKTADATHRYAICGGLARLNEVEGLEQIEKLYRDSCAFRRDPKKAVPLDWITEDLLTEELGTPGALALRERLLALHI